MFLYIYDALQKNFRRIIFHILIKKFIIEALSMEAFWLEALMVLFLPILGWNFLESLGQSVGLNHRTTCNLH